MAVELIAASPVAAALDTDADEVVTITISENGVLDLGRLQLWAAENSDIVGYSSHDLSECAQVSSILINGSTELVRGRNTAAPPASVFSPYRAQRFLDLGQWAFSTGDTVAFTLQVQGTNVTGDCTFAAPFSPRNVREGYIGPMPASKMAYAGSPVSEIAASATANLTCTFDEDGVVDLDSLVIRAMDDQAATGEYGPESLSSLLVTQITTPGNQQLIVGQAPGGISGATFRATRNGNWLSMGRLAVSAGSTLILGVDNNSVDVKNTSFGVAYWPGDGKGGFC
jgi:hypothetical protein